MDKISAGEKGLNKFLQGGYEKEVVTTIYGPGGSGKTLLLMLAMQNTSEDEKIIYIDTEGGFSVERLKQISRNHEEIMNRTTFLNPTNFDEQEEAFNKLKELINTNVSMVLVDTLTSLYRVEMNSEDNYDLNKRLAKQLHDLVELARNKNIPIIVTGQVYQDFEDPEQLNVVGGTIVQNMSKCLLELRKENNHRKLIVKKHRAIPEGKSFEFKITGEGIKEVQG